MMYIDCCLFSFREMVFSKPDFNELYEVEYPIYKDSCDRIHLGTNVNEFLHNYQTYDLLGLIINDWQTYLLFQNTFAYRLPILNFET